MGEQFPRALTNTEFELLTWILPQDRPGYKLYRAFLENSSVIAKGRRGEGNYIIAPDGVKADNESPLPQIFAYGNILTETGELSVSLRERLEDQVEFEIVSVRGSVRHDEIQEIRRWTFSTWLPGQTCPKCEMVVRGVSMRTEHGQQLVLALCALDRLIWLYDSRTGVSHPMPVTNYYNELMLHKNIRDPGIALDSRRLFTDLSQYSDTDLIHAFRAYNQLRAKVELDSDIVIAQEKLNVLKRLQQVFGLGNSRG